MLITNIDKFIDIQFNLLNDYISRFKFNKSLKKDSNDFLKYFDKKTTVGVEPVKKHAKITKKNISYTAIFSCR